MTIRGLATINLLYTNLFSFFVVTVAPGSAADWPNLWLVRKGAITNMMSWVKRFLENQEILSRALWVRWLLVGVCSAVHASFGTESQSHTSLAFLMPEQQHHKFTHVLEFPEC